MQLSLAIPRGLSPCLYMNLRVPQGGDLIVVHHPPDRSANRGPGNLSSLGEAVSSDLTAGLGPGSPHTLPCSLQLTAQPLPPPHSTEDHPAWPPCLPVGEEGADLPQAAGMGF